MLNSFIRKYFKRKFHLICGIDGLKGDFWKFAKQKKKRRKRKRTLFTNVLKTTSSQNKLLKSNMKYINIGQKFCK